MDGHPIFDAFAWLPLRHGTDSVFNEIGAVQRRVYDAGLVGNQPSAPAPAERIGPRLDEDYFEWIDILLAVKRYADERPDRPFVFVELGAGFGRWSVNAICALRQIAPGAPYLVIAVEPEPQHFAWLKQHLSDNNVTNVRLLNAPVAAQDTTVAFEEGGDPQKWYGQYIVPGRGYPTWHPKALWRRYFGDGHRIIDRRAVTLTQVIEDIDIVDIVDMDIQMAEADVIDASLSTLAKIVRLHIGTHSPAIEDRLDQTLSRAGWLNERRFTWETLQSTPYGEVPFGDGMQSWSNPVHA